MQSAMSLQGQRVQDYTFAGVREVFIELFCAPRSSLDNPNLRRFSGGRSFCVLDQGEMDGTTGYWVEDDGNGEVGFLMEFEDTFWVFDETSYVWMARKFAGRRFRKGQPKGKGKGKGAKGKSRFIPFKPRYKGGKKGQAHQTDSAWAGKGGKPRKGGKPQGANPRAEQRRMARDMPMPRWTTRYHHQRSGSNQPQLYHQPQALPPTPRLTHPKTSGKMKPGGKVSGQNRHGGQIRLSLPEMSPRIHLTTPT
jgi:hypothetical protein